MPSLTIMGSYLKTTLILLCPLLLLLLYLAAPPPQPHLRPYQPVSHGVGFSLSLDYATTSVYFPNGTTVDIAKIEGSRGYKSFMRRLQDLGVGEVYSWKHKEGITIENPWLWPGYVLCLPVLKFVRQGWLRRQIRADGNVLGIKDMVEALKRASEQYLGEKVEVADIAVPVYLSEGGRYVISHAVKLATNEGNGRIVDAGIVAAMANGTGSTETHPRGCSDVNRLVLTLDYSRAALTAALYKEDDCVFEPLRECYRVDVGAEFNEQCMQETDDEESCFHDLTQALTEIAKMPVEDGRDTTPYWHGVPTPPCPPTEVGVVVLLGEKGDDSVLRKVLREVLAKQVIDLLALN